MGSVRNILVRTENYGRGIDVYPSHTFQGRLWVGSERVNQRQARRLYEWLGKWLAEQDAQASGGAGDE